MRYAITREVSPAIHRCELEYLERHPIDLDVARAQHSAYRDLLGELGCTVIHLPGHAELPDSVFVEDIAVVVGELAIMTRPGAASRRAETDAIAAALAPYKELAHLSESVRIDGGDVLQLGRRIWIGLSSRTDEAAIGEVRNLLEPRGYDVRAVEVAGCLHLKSAATAAAADTVLFHPDRLAADAFDGCRSIEVDPLEPDAGNVLVVGETVVVAAAYPRTRERLERAGLVCRTIEASELARAEGALTCCSILFEAAPLGGSPTTPDLVRPHDG